MTNPLLTTWTTPFGLPPFDDISDDDFAPAVDAALDEARAAIDAIASNDAPATFENTILAMEIAELPLGKVLGTFYGVAGADSNPAREALQREFGPKLSAFGSEITENKALFARIEDLWTRRDDLDLTAEQTRVLMLTRRGFVRQGALLTGDDAARLRHVKSRLSVLGTSFTQNLLADERSWVMALAEDDLEGLPDFVIATARAAGAEKDAGGPAPAKAAAESDAKVLERMLHADGFDGPLEPWDWRYYSEKRRQAEHDLDEAALKPYLQLDRMIEASFACANRLFGLEFAPLEGPVYHPDVRMWEVTRDGAHVAVFIGDYFARGSKRSGAWCMAMQAQHRMAGEVRPHVVNVCNFAKPEDGQPALNGRGDACGYAATDAGCGHLRYGVSDG